MSGDCDARSAARERTLARAAGAVDSLCTGLLVVGAAIVVFWRPGLWLLTAGFAGLLGGHLAVGIVGYRSVMRRTWPKVEPLDSDDDDW